MTVDFQIVEVEPNHFRKPMSRIDDLRAHVAFRSRRRRMGIDRERPTRLAACIDYGVSPAFRHSALEPLDIKVHPSQGEMS